jgi:photoactive yellow protein
MQAFDSSDLLQWLETNSESEYDTMDFGIVRMDHEGTVVAYNLAQSNLSGMKKEQVLGKHFFKQVSPCTNNFMVAGKYNVPELDETIPYMLTYVTKPVKVTLRLIKSPDGHQYLLSTKG